MKQMFCLSLSCSFFFFFVRVSFGLPGDITVLLSEAKDWSQSSSKERTVSICSTSQTLFPQSTLQYIHSDDASVVYLE